MPIANSSRNRFVISINFASERWNDGARASSAARFELERERSGGILRIDWTGSEQELRKWKARWLDRFKSKSESRYGRR
jgi:hypothetical protein